MFGTDYAPAFIAANTRAADEVVGISLASVKHLISDGSEVGR
jgi:hypothetical protein